MTIIARPGHVAPVVLDPARLASVMSRQGQPLTPVVTDIACTGALSSAEVRMPPRHTSLAHVHHHTGVLLVLLVGRAVTLWWDRDGIVHELAQVAGEHLFMPPGVPHAAINPYAQPAVGAEVRNNPVFDADNDLLPDLDAQVATRTAAILATR